MKRAHGSEVAVTVTCHGAYLKWLRACLESIDAQDPEPAERILALDGCEPPGWLEEMPWWQVVRGHWGAPAPGRNEGMWRTRSPWLIAERRSKVVFPRAVRPISGTEALQRTRNSLRQ